MQLCLHSWSHLHERQAYSSFLRYQLQNQWLRLRTYGWIMLRNYSRMGIFNLAFPLICLEIMGMRLTFVKCPLFMRLTASWTGLLSGEIIRGCLLSLIRSYSLAIPAANASDSIYMDSTFCKYLSTLRSGV